MKKDIKKEIAELNSELLKLLSERNPKSLDVISKIKKIGITNNDNGIIGYAYYRYAYYYYFTNQDLKKFRSYIIMAIKFLLRSDNKEFLGASYNLVAYDAQDLGCYDSAYAYFMTAAKITENIEGIPLPGLIQANAGRLLLELGDYKTGQKQLKKALKIMTKYTSMHVYNYNMIFTYTDLALSYFLLHDSKAARQILDTIEDYYQKANKQEKNLSKTYYLLSKIYSHILNNEEEKFDFRLNELLKDWKKHDSAELAGLMFEIETICNYLLKHDYISQVSQILNATKVLANENNLAVALKYYALRVSYYEKIHDLKELKKCLLKQHEINRKHNAETSRTRRYAMEFADMIENIAKETDKVKEENIALKIKANTDSLTGLPNRNALNNYLSKRFTEAEKNKTNFGIGIIDVDKFKQFNDHYGHQMGDECLRLVGKALLSFTNSPNVFIARYGGDEFVVGYFGLSDKEILSYAKQMKSRVIKETSTMKLKDNEEICISQGFYNEIPRKKQKLWDYLTIADKELYKIKSLKSNK